MLGQYPHCQPSAPGPSADDARAHLRRVRAAGVDCFACLQAELPPQDAPDAWPAGGVQRTLSLTLSPSLTVNLIPSPSP